MVHCQELTGDEEKEKSSTWKSNIVLMYRKFSAVTFINDVNQKKGFMFQFGGIHVTYTEPPKN